MSIRDDILARLYEGETSGEALAAQLGVTRAAVWKAIRQLNADGYTVTSSRKGYRLEGGDVPSAPGISHYLHSSWNVTAYPEATSTNDIAKALAEKGADRAAVAADRQTRGRGRLGRQFISPPGSGLYMSVVMRPELTAADCGRITAFAAVVVARAIERLCGARADIKWVNDVYMNGKKVCGILTEGGFGMENGRLSYAVTGIGINVRHAVFPREVAEIATRIEEAIGTAVDRCALAAAVLDGMADMEREVKSGGFTEEYRRRSCVIGKRVTVNGEYEALATGIADDCSLELETDDGRRLRFSAGEVSLKL